MSLDFAFIFLLILKKKAKGFKNAPGGLAAESGGGGGAGTHDGATEIKEEEEGKKNHPTSAPFSVGRRRRRRPMTKKKGTFRRRILSSFSPWNVFVWLVAARARRWEAFHDANNSQTIRQGTFSRWGGGSWSIFFFFFFGALFWRWWESDQKIWHAWKQFRCMFAIIMLCFWFHSIGKSVFDRVVMREMQKRRNKEGQLGWQGKKKKRVWRRMMMTHAAIENRSRR